MTTAEALYRDSLLRWLQNRRDHPHDNTPEPIPDWVLDSKVNTLETDLGVCCAMWGIFIPSRIWAIREEVIREFERTQ